MIQLNQRLILRYHSSHIRHDRVYSPLCFRADFGFTIGFKNSGISSLPACIFFLHDFCPDRDGFGSVVLIYFTLRDLFVGFEFEYQQKPQSYGDPYSDDCFPVHFLYIKKVINYSFKITAGSELNFRPSVFRVFVLFVSSSSSPSVFSIPDLLSHNPLPRTDSFAEPGGAHCPRAPPPSATRPLPVEAATPVHKFAAPSLFHHDLSRYWSGRHSSDRKSVV